MFLHGPLVIGGENPAPVIIPYCQPPCAISQHGEHHVPHAAPVLRKARWHAHTARPRLAKHREYKALQVHNS